MQTHVPVFPLTCLVPPWHLLCWVLLTFPSSQASQSSSHLPTHFLLWVLTHEFTCHPPSVVSVHPSWPVLNCRYIQLLPSPTQGACIWTSDRSLEPSVSVVVQSLSHVQLWPHGLQHARLLCPSLSPRVCSNSCPLSQWCHPTISSSVTVFSCPQSFPASGSFPMSWLFASGSQIIGASASAFPMNIRVNFL